MLLSLRLFAAVLTVAAALSCPNVPDGCAQDEARLRDKYGLEAPRCTADGGALQGNIDIGISVKGGDK